MVFALVFIVWWTYAMAFVTRKKLEEVYPLCVALSLFVVMYVVYRFIPEATIRSAITSAGVFGPVLWIIAGILTYVLAPISGAPLLLLGFYAFGKMTIVYSVFVSAVGSVINFWIARKWGRKVVLSLIGQKPMAKLDGVMEHLGPATLFFLRVFLSGPHDSISYLSGLTAISFAEYYAITLLAFIPSTAIWYSSSFITSNPIGFTGVSLGISGGLSVLYFIVRWWYKRGKRR